MISVVICTHNPRRDYFARCLAGLSVQTVPASEWEVVLVDNASEPAKAPSRDMLSWHPNVKLVSEPNLGLTPARLKGIREAAGDLLVLVDDDNVLDPDFLEQALSIMRGYPFLGSWSGQCRPEFEAPPPEWTRRYWGNLVIREFSADVWSNLPRLAATMPCGAGLCVRRAVAQRYLALNDSGQRAFQLDRAGTSLLSGGDNDLAACACDIGLGVGLMTALKLVHLIPPQRLTVDYLARLAEGIHFSSVLLDRERGLPVAPRGKVGQLVDLLRLARLQQPHRTIVQAANRGRDRAIAHLSRQHGVGISTGRV